MSKYIHIDMLHVSIFNCIECNKSNSHHFVMVLINLTCPHCLQHFFFEHLFHLYAIKFYINNYFFSSEFKNCLTMLD